MHLKVVEQRSPGPQNQFILLCRNDPKITLTEVYWTLPQNLTLTLQTMTFNKGCIDRQVPPQMILQKKHNVAHLIEEQFQNAAV